MGWASIDQALSPEQAQDLLKWAQAQKIKGLFHAAEMGRGSERHQNQQLRGDSTYWLEAALHPPLFAALDVFQQKLNKELYLGLQEFECHFAHYPAGARYDKHLDKTVAAQPLSGERVISFVLYLNKNWTADDGGMLKLYVSPEQLIEPTLGRMIVFRSDSIWHEVLISNNERWSLTGWFRRRRL